MASTIQTFDFALKTRYTDQKVENLTLADRPLMAMVSKDEEFSGEGTKIPLIHGNPQGIAGSSRAQAQTSATNAKGKFFLITNGRYRGSVEIGDEVIKASRNNPGAFLQNKVVEIDGLYEQMADNIAFYLYRNGGGALGQRASISGNVITLANPLDALAFEESMRVVASANDGSDAAHSLRTGSTFVTAVDRIAGTVTVDNAGDITSFANNDFLFRQGDFAGNSDTIIIKGLSAYLWHTTAPPVLYGMTRTSDPQRLAGSRLLAADVVGKNIEERMRLLGSRMTGVYKGPGADKVFLNPDDWTRLETVMASKGIRALEDKTAKFGFMKIDAVLGGKMVSIYPDRWCPVGTAFFLRMQNWKLHSMLRLIHPLNGDGLTMLRKGSTDDYEYRLISYPVLSCNAPGYSGRVELPAAA